MGKRDKLLQRLLEGHYKNVRFTEFRHLVESYGFVLARIAGSHHIFTHPMIHEILNIQNVQGEAKPYQIRQALQLIERHDLRASGEWH